MKNHRVLTALENDSLIAYEPSCWEDVKRKITKMDSKPEREAFTRLVIARSTEVDFRREYFYLPSHFRDLFGQATEVIVHYKGNKVKLTPST